MMRECKECGLKWIDDRECQHRINPQDWDFVIEPEIILPGHEPEDWDTDA